jgi:hypothetical protein
MISYSMGHPPIWKYARLPQQVSKDRGKAYVDENAARFPGSPLAPLVAAVSHYNPSYDFSSIDIVSDRNNLRKLLKWVGGYGGSQDFRIDLQLAGCGTVLFTRREKSARVSAGGPNSESYGHEFERVMTRRAHGCDNSSGHHRIISYVRNISTYYNGSFNGWHSSILLRT